ncbi:MAG: AAA family ATPase [Candidatus Aenigmarchaeota archaeon]|nr:AAA family ATPase [Candidatus Aenigmarchaeota archaeon]
MIDEKEARTENNSPQATDKSVEKWFSHFGWSKNPFILNIEPRLLVGYEEQRDKLLRHIQENQKVALVIGPTGSGKTTLLKWCEAHLDPTFESIFLGKPPERPENFIDILRNKFKPSIIEYLSQIFFNKSISLNELPSYINKKLGKKTLVLFCDEIHEATQDVLSWLRVLNDQVENMTLIISGLPVFEKRLKKELESFYKRITTKITTLSLTKEETRQLIEKRIKKVGGSGTGPFSDNVIDYIYDKTGGFPREVLCLANQLINLAMESSTFEIRPEILEHKKEKAVEENFDMINNLPSRQREIVKILQLSDSSPNQIVSKLDLKKYKTKQHAVRSVNNILKRLLKNKIVTRKVSGKTYIYVLSSKYKTLGAES